MGTSNAKLDIVYKATFTISGLLLAATLFMGNFILSSFSQRLLSVEESNLESIRIRARYLPQIEQQIADIKEIRKLIEDGHILNISMQKDVIKIKEEMADMKGRINK